MKSINTLVILAGGASSRMKRPVVGTDSPNLSKEEIAQANTKSKGLITLGKNGHPLLDYLLYNAKQAGLSKVVFLTGVNSTPFRKHFQGHDGIYHGLQVFFAEQRIPRDREKPMGTADALLQTLDQQPWLKTERFIVCNSDNLYSTHAMELLKNCSKPNAFISYDRDSLKFSTDRINRFALVRTGPEGTLKDIIEKPTKTEAEAYKDTTGKFRVSMNIFMFNGPMIYPYLVSCPMHAERMEKELPTALLHMVHEHPGSVTGIPLSEHVPDLTSKEDIVIFKTHIEEQYPKDLWEGS